MANTSSARRVARDLVPPIVMRKLRTYRTRRTVASAPPDARSGLNPDRIEYGAEFYDESFENEDRWKLPYFQLSWYGSWSVIGDRVAAEPEPSVLDLGCGAGHLARLLADRGVRRYVGFDFSEKRLEHARSVVPEFRFEVADAYTTDLFDTVDYGIVTCTEFLEHLAGDLEILARVRSGVRVLGTVPNYDATAHLRFFDNADEVRERYEHCFTDLTVTRIHNISGSSEWLLDGHRS